jgi:uncharacterized membrane protein
MPQLIVIVSGAVLMLTGIVLVVIEMRIQMNSPGTKRITRSFNVSGPFKTKATLKTTYAGLVMILLGAVMEVVAYLATAPWK